MLDDFIFDEKSLVVFDLEWTAWPGSFERDWSDPGEMREIIQFGAVRADVASGLTETGYFEGFARPTVYPNLSDYIIDLTGISQPDMDSALPLAEAWPAFREFIGGGALLICCNDYDHMVLGENCAINNIDDAMGDLKFHNLRPMIIEALGSGGEAPVSTDLARLFGLANSHQSHTALGDSRNILDALRHLQNMR